MTDAQVEKCRKRLEQFLMDLLEPVGRTERRHWGAVYIRGLLLNGERKSIEPLADRSNEGNVQALQQFVGQSPWDWMPLWERLSKRMTAELEPDSVWVIDDTGFAKQGKHSVGVERQYSGTLGKVGNCQVAVSLHHVGEQGSTVLGWRLYLPESWTKDDKRREEAGIPEEVVFKTKWQLSYVVGISSTTGVWSKPPQAQVPRYQGRGAPATRYAYGKQRPTSAQDTAVQAKSWKRIRWRQGTKGWLESRFAALRVQPSHGFVRGQPPHKEVWLLIEWPESEKEPTKYFLCDLPATYTLRRLVRLAKCRWKIEQDYQQLKEELGLDHYEGRSWIGWHHHTTLVMLTHAFLILEMLRGKKNFWLDPATDAS